jgi:hypothetical protein
MARTRDIKVYGDPDDKIYTVDEAEAKILARAIELMYLVKDADIVTLMLGLETGHRGMLLLGYVQVAEAAFKDPASVYFSEWIKTEEYFPL